MPFRRNAIKGGIAMTLVVHKRSLSELFRKVSIAGAGMVAGALVLGGAASAESLRIATPNLPPALGDPQSSTARSHTRMS